MVSECSTSPLRRLCPCQECPAVADVWSVPQFWFSYTQALNMVDVPLVQHDSGGGACLPLSQRPW